MTELLASHALIFSTSKSDSIVKELCDAQPSGKKIDMSIVRNFTESFVEVPFQLGDFPILGSRLRYIHERMTGWRPLRFGQLFQRPYRDSIPFFAFWFAAVIGLVAVLSLGIGVGQLVYAILMYKTDPLPIP